MTMPVTSDLGQNTKASVKVLLLKELVRDKTVCLCFVCLGRAKLLTCYFPLVLKLFTVVEMCSNRAQCVKLAVCLELLTVI